MSEDTMQNGRLPNLADRNLLRYVTLASFGGMVTGTVNESFDYRGIMYLVGTLGLGLFLLVPLIDIDKSKINLMLWQQAMWDSKTRSLS